MASEFQTHLLTVPQHLRAVVSAYGQNVVAFAGEIDPEDELDWFALWVGFALGRSVTLGRGVPVVDATDYSFYDEYVFPLESMQPEDLAGSSDPEYLAYLKSPLDPRD